DVSASGPRTRRRRFSPSASAFSISSDFLPNSCFQSMATSLWSLPGPRTPDRDAPWYSAFYREKVPVRLARRASAVCHQPPLKAYVSHKDRPKSSRRLVWIDIHHSELFNT